MTAKLKNTLEKIILLHKILIYFYFDIILYIFDKTGGIFIFLFFAVKCQFFSQIDTKY